QITQYEHAIQAAYFTEKFDAADYELIIAAFLHDIGHLLGKDEDELMSDYGVMRHEIIGAEYLKQRHFSDRICRLIQNHVNAKRYLTYINNDYYNKLSDASKKTLEYQGGPMTQHEAEKFQQDPLFNLCLKLRSFDEAAKLVDFDYTEKGEHYWTLVRNHLISNSLQ
ncbi:unnamed protein product, partial [Didymodactylos carnosus]